MKIASEKITSRQNRLVIEVGKLTDRKARTTEKRFRFDGVKLFREAVEKGVSIEKILILEDRAHSFSEVLDTFENAPSLADATVYFLSADAFSKVSGEQAPEGIITVARFPEMHVKGQESVSVLSAFAADPEARVLLLESVRDPGNVGTILRSAAAFGIRCVVMSTDCADIYNSKTIRGAMGALFRMPIVFFDDITEAIGILREEGRRVFAAALDPHALQFGKAPVQKGDCVVIGYEGHGLSENTVRACGQSLYIPMEEGSESLNAAIAASVLLWGLYNT